MAGKAKTGRKKTEDRLAAYRAKRSADRTPEPFGGAPPGPAGLFVVQKHAARSLHYDLRLEIAGVLHSWAVPKGPSLDPAQKRLAMEVEDHPLEYGGFEGIIPAGNYGAGAVILWDRGRWESHGDPEDGVRAGKLLFDLHGHKLRGRWTLFRTKRAPNEWLLMKKPDAHASTSAAPPEASILSGLTVEQLRDGADVSKPIRERLARSRARRGTDVYERPGLMLARVAPSAFSRPGWIFELKYDGYRLLGIRREGKVTLRYRAGGDATDAFPEVATALAALPHEAFVVDGELVVLDETGRPSFQRLQRRARGRRRPALARAAAEHPATLFLFDLLAFEDFDLRTLPLVERKELLRGLLPPVGPLRFSDHVEEHGEAFFEEVERMRLEGVVAKRGASPYRDARSEDWLKVRCDRTGLFAVVGFTAGAGSRAGFGALHLAVREGGGLVYAGRVGSGFDTAMLEALRAELEASKRSAPPCGGPVPAGEDHTWVEPRRVCEVRFKEWTDERLLRQPVFLGMRDDAPLDACVREEPFARSEPGTDSGADPDDEREPGAASGASASGREPAADAAAGSREDARSGSRAAPRREPRALAFTNTTKVFWPREGYTKGDLIEYYRAVSEWLLPYLEDRPVVLTRYPDGIEGKNFFQKDAPGFTPEWLRTVRTWSEDAKREIHYFVCDDLDSLLYLANLGTIPLHLWSSRVANLERPDWSILDLDPKEAPFEHVVRVAKECRSLCDAIGVEAFVKTSGSTGLHVLLPLGGQCTYEQSRELARVLARVVVSRLPEIATLTRSPGARGGRVYVDTVQNGHGRLLVAPFSLRPLPGAPVSTPLQWSEVRKGLDIRRFDLRSVPARLAKMKKDPLRPVLDRRPNLVEVLARLAEHLDRK